MSGVVRGGMELLFDNQRSLSLSLPSSYSLSNFTSTGFTSASLTDKEGQEERQTDIRYLIHYLLHCALVDKARPDLFAQGDTVFVYPPLL